MLLCLRNVLQRSAFAHPSRSASAADLESVPIRTHRPMPDQPAQPDSAGNGTGHVSEQRSSPRNETSSPPTTHRGSKASETDPPKKKRKVNHGKKARSISIRGSRLMSVHSMCLLSSLGRQPILAASYFTDFRSHRADDDGLTIWFFGYTAYDLRFCTTPLNLPRTYDFHTRPN